MATIAIIGAFDTKGKEFGYLKDRIEQRGHKTFTIDFGIGGSTAFPPNIPAARMAEAGKENLEALLAANDRGRAVAAMARGARKLIPVLHREGRFDALIGMGGSAGTSVATAAMRALPLGTPKVMISTLAGGDVSDFVGVKDIVMIPSIVDVSGLNRIFREVMAKAAGAVCGMAETSPREGEDKPIIAATMFGNTTRCVGAAQRIFEAKGYEVLVFHATGSGGRSMESLVQAGYVKGVFDITTTEWADELTGGVFSAGPTRLEAAAAAGVPAVIAPGCLDMANFHALSSVPEKYRERILYEHNPNVTLMRTTPEECSKLGRIIAEKINASTGPTAVYLPLGGISEIALEGGPFYSPEADSALFSALKENLRKDIPVYELDVDINDPLFARKAAEGLLELMGKSA